jgi:hypothetical protein
MIYLLLASLVYSWIAVDVLQSEPPATFRDAIGAALLCAVLAAMWPPVVLWRLILGPARNTEPPAPTSYPAIAPGLQRHQPSA